MELVLNNNSGDDLTEFIKWLMPQIVDYFIDSINEDQTDRIDAYLNGDGSIGEKLSKRISSYNILVGAMNYLTYSHVDERVYRIFIDPNAYIPNSQLTFARMVQLIDEGNLQLSSYPVWTKTIEYFDENVNDLYDEFLEEGGEQSWQ